MKIMAVDDEENILLAIRHIAEKDGYQYCSAPDGETALSLVKEEKPDLIILDVMMPDMNGFQVCEELRRQDDHTPIIFLSAKGDIVDKGIGFTAGGDDYLVKPFNPRELSLRMNALLRRAKRDGKSGNEYLKREDSAAFDELEIFFNRYEVRLRGMDVGLTSKEFEILALLASHPGQVYTRQQILEHIWGNDSGANANSITVFMRKIREKIEDDPAKPKYLLTVWRIGYKFYKA
ncbi:MAG: response regulator transcription factor [Lachnospiraceae bacterium]|nr:response regulator transcription factor [Lachnospiraceae bacterium]